MGSTPASADTSARTSPQAEPAASTYGTRSRQRGTNRPNYAEDRESEMEFEYTATKSSQSSDTKPRAYHKKDSAEPNTKKPSSDSAHTKASTSNGVSTKDATRTATHAPGVESKKRKMPSSSASGATTNTQSSSRKTSHNVSNGNLAARDSSMVSFELSGRFLQNGCLVSDTGEKYKTDDYVYLVCEPPGEPYYLARIMEFLHAQNDPDAPIDAMRINWMYRPRDINRKEQDSRGVFASMHSDPCPITSIRGKCIVKHRADIDDLDEFKKQKDSFYFSQMYDRYIHRYYDIIPTKAVINVPDNVKKVLDERWKFIIVEIGKGKEFTSAIKTCKRCTLYCASDNSVDCAVCKNTYHMNCVQPPLQKKPARGFAWSCGPCSRRQERKLEARNTPLVEGDEEEEYYEEEEGDALNTNGTSPAAGGGSSEILTATKDQIAHSQMWPYRYLGIHCKPTDALDYDDRIYPRASSRIGPKYQVSIPDWPGRPFEFVKSAESRRKWGRGGAQRGNPRLFKDPPVGADGEKKERRPRWVVDQPPGYLARGEDPDNSTGPRTSTLLFKLPRLDEEPSRGTDDTAISKPSQAEEALDEYMEFARDLCQDMKLVEGHTNFLDRAVQMYQSTGYDESAARALLEKTSIRKDLKEPNLSKEDIKKFEEAVAKYGSQLGDITRSIKTQKFGDIVRFWYTWKKTKQGKLIWGSREDRKSKKHVKMAEGTFLDDVADDADDSAFDNDKAAKKKRGFMCKFCSTKESRFWRRAPLATPGQTIPSDGNTRNKEKSNLLMVALCGRCANLWRKYAIKYESVDEIARKIAQIGGRALKRKADEELFREIVEANEVGHVYMNSTIVTAAQAIGLEITPALTVSNEDSARKKQKTTGDSKSADSSTPPAVEATKKKAEKPPAPELPPLVPELPRARKLPCAVCLQLDVAGTQLFSCRTCKLTVHRSCYGIPEGKLPAKWICDCCANDTANQVSTDYVCTLCPMDCNEVELFELPKGTHKRKSERDREKERLERELFLEAIANYQKQQEELGRPIVPREALKSTAGYRWMHAICAIWTLGINFWDAKLLDKPEGILDIPAHRFGEVCKICQIGKGVCSHCPACDTAFHVSCAQKAGYTMGFFVTPVKGSRKDVVPSAHFGNESGHVEAVVYCSHHENVPELHPMHEVFEDGSTALQTFVRHFKQADPTFTGTMRKAAAVANSIVSALAIRDPNISHRGSISNGTIYKPSASGLSSREPPPAVVIKEEIDDSGDRIVHLQTQVVDEGPLKICKNCSIDVSPKWHKHQVEKKQVNGYGDHGPENGHSFYYCHKCYMRKQNESKLPPPPPPPPVAKEPVPEPTTVAPAPVIQQAPVSNWASSSAPVPPVPVPLPQSNRWPTSLGHAQQTQARAPSLQPSLMNGVSRASSSSQALQPAYRLQFGLSPTSYPYSSTYDNREASVNGSQRAYAPLPAVATTAAAATTATEFNHRSSDSNTALRAYSGPSQGSPSYAPASALASATATPQSPPVYRINNAPTGPPRASDNPFYAMPSHTSHESYPSASQASPRRTDDRSQTQQPSRPWDPARDHDKPAPRSVAPVANGASNSPSLKNLLH